MLSEAKHQVAETERHRTRINRHTDPSLWLRMTIPNLRDLSNQVTIYLANGCATSLTPSALQTRAMVSNRGLASARNAL